MHGRVAPRWAAVVVNYEAGPLLADVRRARCSPTRAPGTAGDRRRRQRLARRLGRRARARVPRRARGRAPAATSGTRRGANLGIAATRAPVVAVLQRRHRRRAGHGGGDARRASTREPDLARGRARGCGTPTAPQYPSARSHAVDRSTRSATGCSALVVPRRTASPAATASSTPTRTRPRDVDWVSGAAVWLRRDALDAVGGWDERYFMYLEDVDLCWRLRRPAGGSRTSPAARVVARAGGEHRRGARTG